MESLLLRALESTLRYWLKTFVREQFKLRGRSVHLYDLDLNGDVLHASIGLPPTLRVTQARVRKLELKIPSLSNVNKDPIVVEIDKLELILTEKLPSDLGYIPGTLPSASSGKSNSYGYSDKLADGMTVRVGTVNLMLETQGGSKGEAAWTPPLASITMRNLDLYTTNEYWRVVPLNQAREFPNNRKAIYVFKKLEWESLSVDLLPHPNMFTDDRLSSPSMGDSERDNDGAKRLFFGGERFLDNIAGAAYITIKRTEQNKPLGLEVQLHVPEILCPSLSEPGLRALLRFMTGIYVCMNRGDVDVRSTQSDDAAGRTLVGVRVDHIFLCIKDTEFQLELLLQSLHYVRSSANDGDCRRTMAHIVLGYLFLRDTFSHPSCTLVQPSMHPSRPRISQPVPSFASEKLWPRIHPLERELVPKTEDPPMLCMYSSQTAPSPAPPTLSSQTVIQCQPLKINLQEESCLRIASFLADGVVVEPGVVVPDTSLNAMYFSLKEFDLTVPVKTSPLDEGQLDGEDCFTGARLHVEGFMMAQSPFLNFRLLNLDKDPACFSLWKGQPVDSSQQRWVMRATHLSIALETGSCDDLAQSMTAADWAAGLWRCVEMYEPCVEAAMVTADGRSLITVPPPGGTVRLGIACKKYMSNTSSEQFLFVLKMYTYMGKVSEALLQVSKAVTQKEKGLRAGAQKLVSSKELTRTASLVGLVEMAPGDSAVFLSVEALELKLLESVPAQAATEGPPLVQILSWGISLSATQRTLAAAAVISSSLRWQDIRVDCVETELAFAAPTVSHYGSPLTQMFERRRVSFSDSPLGSPFRTPQTSFSGASSSRESASSERQRLPSEVPQTSGRRQRFEQGLPHMRAVFWIGEERGSMAPTGRDVSGKESRTERLPFLDIHVENVIPYKDQGSERHSLKVVAKVGGVRLGGGMAYNEALLHRFGVFGPDGGPGEEVKKVIRSLSKGSLANMFRPSPDVVGSARKGDVPTDDTDDNSWEVGLPDEIDLDLQLLDWLFALEGTKVAELSPSKRESPPSREDRCWHSTFRCLRIIARGTRQSSDSTIKDQRTSSGPVQRVIMKIEGLQALKPRSSFDPAIQDPVVVDNGDGSKIPLVAEWDENGDTVLENGDMGDATGSERVDNTGASENHDTGLGNEPLDGRERLTPENPTVTSHSGFDVEVRLVEREDEIDTDIGMGEWVVESFRAAVREPVEVEATKRELEYMVELCKLEIESASRIAAGGLKLLQLHGPIGQSAIDQLSIIGSGSLDRVLTPDRDKHSRRFSEGSVQSTPMRRSTKETTIAALEAAIVASQALCLRISQNLIWVQEERCGSAMLCCDSTLVDEAPTTELNALTEQLQSMQALLGILKNDI